ncbi:hypothetical protein PR202_ga17631 [Eleusine coracana subsp. coracana]|uniref:Transcription factor MYC/MYB N-terminal domain-containing protein n=1 Tax=Eleusine coracana subsp. coracana TaxID=191504 RepID=A0AAV5CPF9_ELECO|nr:hypothetical protein PR202_ga17384 [Eleusine coracana subsp. coracana]GJN00449.1 hypothetical protein PR202_ga17631 [Eleusine coracana subsp. coracana]
MEEQLSPVAVTHLLQHTLRSLCTGDAPPQWVYAVFWRILPRNYPPPKCDPCMGGRVLQLRGHHLCGVWEEGAAAYAAGDCEAPVHHQQEAAAKQQQQGLQPELFFKMSHDIYNYGEGLIGKVAADHSHKWVLKEPSEQETNLISSWSNPADSHPRTWEAQFQSGIQTIALIAVREGVVQLGSMKKVAEDLRYVVMLRRKFGYLESIPGVLLPHPSSAGAFPLPPPDLAAWHPGMMPPPAGPLDLYDPYVAAAAGPAAAAASMHIMPSMSSLEALLSKLPSVVPAPPPPQQQTSGPAPPGTAAAKEEEVVDEYARQCHGGMEGVPSNGGGGESAGASGAAAGTAPMSSYFVDVGGKPGEGF